MSVIIDQQNKVNLAIYNNSWYNPGGGAIKRFIWYITNILFFINPLNPVNNIKIWLLRLFGAKIGHSVIIKPGVNIKYPWHLTIGDHVWIGENVWIDNLTMVTIADNVILSQGSMLLTGSHNYKKPAFDLMVGEIKLEEGAWIGAKAIVCPGVTCHSHSILAVNSIATADLKPYMIYQGNPATAKRERNIFS